MFEREKVKFTLDFEVTRAKVAFAVAIFVITVFPFGLGSENNQSFAGYFPVPSGYIDRVSAMTVKLGTLGSGGTSFGVANDYTMTITTQTITMGNSMSSTMTFTAATGPMLVSNGTISLGGHSPGSDVTVYTTVVPQDIGSAQAYMADLCTWVVVSGTPCGNTGWTDKSGNTVGTPIALARGVHSSDFFSASGVTVNGSFLDINFSTPLAWGATGVNAPEYVLCCKFTTTTNSSATISS